MGAVVRVWLKSLIGTFTWGQLHSALEDDGDDDNGDGGGDAAAADDDGDDDNGDDGDDHDGSGSQNHKIEGELLKCFFTRFTCFSNNPSTWFDADKNDYNDDGVDDEDKIDVKANAFDDDDDNNSYKKCGFNDN